MKNISPSCRNRAYKWTGDAVSTISNSTSSYELALGLSPQSPDCLDSVIRLWLLIAVLNFLFDVSLMIMPSIVILNPREWTFGIIHWEQEREGPKHKDVLTEDWPIDDRRLPSWCVSNARTLHAHYNYDQHTISSPVAGDTETQHTQHQGHCTLHPQYPHSTKHDRHGVCLLVCAWARGWISSEGLKVDAVSSLCRGGCRTYK